MSPEELFEENYKFAYWLVRKRFPLLADDEDVNQEALIGLWKACTIYDPKNGKFTTVATRCIMNEVLMFLRKNRRRHNIIFYSLEDELSGADNLRFSDVTPDPNWNVKFCNSEFKQSVSSLTEREQLIVRMRLAGFNQTYIANEVGLSQAYVSRLLKSILKKLGIPGKQRKDAKK